jgi:hypothetical protein
MKHTIRENLTIVIRLEGEDKIFTYEAGDHELHPAVAAVLVDQGIAKPAASKASKTNTETDHEPTKD